MTDNDQRMKSHQILRGTSVANASKPPTTVKIEISDEQKRENASEAKSETEHARTSLQKDTTFGDRDEWSHSVDCVFSMIGFAVAISNISRFIAYYYYYGGMCFLIPYVLFLFTCGFPLLYMECVLGQFFREGFISVWKIVPVMKGIGYSIGMLVLAICFYYMTPVVWCLVYLYHCFSTPLPWSTCTNLWNTPDCIEMIPENFYDAGKGKHGLQRQSSGFEYFRGRVLQIYKSFYSDPPEASQSQVVWNNNTKIERYGFDTNLNLGELRTELAVSLGFVYVITYGLLLMDVKWTEILMVPYIIVGRLTRLTVTVPFAVLSILFFRGIVLEGALDGISVFFTMNATSLLQTSTWLVGATETFYSLGSGFGTHLVIASHNHFHHNVFRDCYITVVVNLILSLFGALTISEYLGHWANIQNKDMTHFVQTKTLPKSLDIIFVVFPDVASRLAGGAIFIFLFMLMIVLVIYDSILIGVKALIVSLADEFRHWFTTPSIGVKVFTFAIVGIVYVINLLCVTHGGIWLYDFLDYHAVPETVLFVNFVQCFGVAWIWGLAELCEATEAICGSKPGLYLRICWKFLVPAFIFTLYVIAAVNISPAVIEGHTVPETFNIIGCIIQYISVLPIPIYAITQCFQRPEGQTRKERVKVLLTPQYEYHKHPQVDEMTGKTLTLKHFVYFGPIKVEKISLFNKGTKKVKPEDAKEPLKKSLDVHFKDLKDTSGSRDDSIEVAPPPVPQNSEVEAAVAEASPPKNPLPSSIPPPQTKRVSSETFSSKKKTKKGHLLRPSST